MTSREKDSSDPTMDDAVSQAREAFIWGLPLLMMGRYLDAARAAEVPFNHFLMNSEVATAKSHAVGPNIDTLNGRAWLDLDAGPQVIGVPDTKDRYYSVQLQDMYMNSFAYIGRRTTGTYAGAFAITPAGFTGQLPEGVTEIRATTSKVLILVRTLVRGPADVAAAGALNAAFTLGPLATYPGERRAAFVGSGAIDVFQPAARRASRTLPHQEIAASGASCFDELAHLVRAFPPLPGDAPHLARLALAGAGSGVPPATLAAEVAAGIDAVQQGLKTWSDNGWSRRPNVEAFILDPLQRAANNLYGPNTQVAEESVFYNMRLGPDGTKLNGANRYRLHFAAGQTPPVDAFWSLTLYDKQYNLFDNPLDRYGITDRTDGLLYGPDGSLEIRIAVDPPAEDHINWLPSPPDEFQIILRTYQPRAAILDRSYRPPGLEIVAGATSRTGAAVH